jgi:nitrate reductase gamma subunit
VEHAAWPVYPNPMAVFSIIRFGMTLYHNLTLAALVVSLASLAYHFLRLVQSGRPRDYSRIKGNIKSAMVYSFLGAMSPPKKESARLHLPTYIAGILYHIGTFASIALLPAFLLDIHLSGAVQSACVGLLAASGLCGVGIFIKRIAVQRVRNLSTVDDYISNGLVTAFHFSTLMLLVDETIAPFYFSNASVLLLYLPFGKLKHALYFLAARYQLGLFYGRRGIWPVRRS